MSSLITTTRADALATLARQPRTTPPGGDWGMFVVPADPIEVAEEPQSVEGVASTYVDPASCTRVFMWAESERALSDLMVSLNAFVLSGIPDSLLDRTTIKISGPHGPVEVSLRDFIDELKAMMLENFVELTSPARVEGIISGLAAKPTVESVQ